MCDVPLMASKEIKYYLHDDLNDDRDIYRQCCKLLAQANELLDNFDMSSVNVKLSSVV